MVLSSIGLIVVFSGLLKRHRKQLATDGKGKLRHEKRAVASSCPGFSREER